MKYLRNPFQRVVESVKEINRNYDKPQIEMTLFVKICLLSLRIYLFTLIGLMIYKFIIAAKY